MKKILFYAGLLTFAASCAEDEFESFAAKDQGKGITFEMADADTRMQWDETTESYVPFWYAEQDRIGLFGLNLLKGQSSTALVGAGFKDLNSTAISADAIYKATQSKKNGVFTSVDDDNLLSFNENKVARFVAVYPSTVKANYAAGKIVLSELPDLANQTQTTTKGANEAMVMYDLTNAQRENSYDAVGEKVSLSFKRPLSALVFKTANADAYTTGDNPIFGDLQTITVETQGYDKTADDGDLNANKGDILPTTLAYDVSKATIEVDTLTKATTFVAGTNPAESSKVELTLNHAWKDGDLAIAAVKNVDRKAFRDKGVSEAISVMFAFANIDIVSTTNTVSVDFNGFMQFPPLDINDYDYLVTKGEAGNTRTLIVNGGKFSDIFAASGKVKWADSESADNMNEVSVTEFQEVIVNEDVVLNDAEFAKLNTFTNVKRLTLKGNTEIKKEVLKNLTLEYINMPAVTTIGKAPFNINSPLKTVLLPAYNFEVLDINPDILKPTLEVLDMSGVDVMNAGFPAKGLSLEGYTALKEVTVKDGVKVGANAFKGCTSLNTVNGKVDIVGTAAFKECEALETINIINTAIEANTFEGATALKNVLYDGKQVNPTSVGVQAFKGCTVLKDMNLENATEIGAEAFMDCVELIGSEKADNNKDVLYVGAEFISKNAFAGCKALTYVYFINATGFGDKILGTGADTAESNYNLKEVKFGTPFTFANVATATAATFVNSGDVKLFVNPNQDPEMLEDAVLVLKKNPAVKITFASITKEAKF